MYVWAFLPDILSLQPTTLMILDSMMDGQKIAVAERETHHARGMQSAWCTVRTQIDAHIHTCALNERRHRDACGGAGGEGVHFFLAEIEICITPRRVTPSKNNSTRLFFA